MSDLFAYRVVKGPKEFKHGGGDYLRFTVSADDVEHPESVPLLSSIDLTKKREFIHWCMDGADIHYDGRVYFLEMHDPIAGSGLIEVITKAF